MSMAEQKRCAKEGVGFFLDFMRACVRVYVSLCVRTQREALLFAIGCSLASMQACALDPDKNTM